MYNRMDTKCRKHIHLEFETIKETIMAKKKQPIKHSEIPKPETKPEIKPVDPEEPLKVPEEDPDIIPDEDPFENPPPNEIPPPGEGP